MDNCLLIGNGLNRCLQQGVAWGNLLEKVAKELGVTYNPDISMPLEFERIINEYLENNSAFPMPSTIYDSVKGKISGIVSDVTLPLDAIHYKLKKVKPNAIMTTNYDTLLEKVFDRGYVYNESKNRKYLFDPTSRISSTKFYHVHGIVNCPKSLCLGYEHYMGVVEHLRTSLNKKRDNKPDEMIIKRILYKEEKPTDIWGERFYTSNIAILGLDLGECESDLWWLITHRAYLYYSNYAMLKNKLSNSIVFYDVIDERKGLTAEELEKQQAINRVKRNRHLLLKKEHVIVKPLILGKDYVDYEEAYEAAIHDININGIGNKD